MFIFIVKSGLFHVSSVSVSLTGINFIKVIFLDKFEQLQNIQLYVFVDSVYNIGFDY